MARNEGENSYKRCYHNTIFSSLRLGISSPKPPPARTFFVRTKPKLQFHYQNRKRKRCRMKRKNKGYGVAAPTQLRPDSVMMMVKSEWEWVREGERTPPPTTFSVHKRKLKMSSRIDFPIPHRPKHFFFRFAFRVWVAMGSLHPCLALFGLRLHCLGSSFFRRKLLRAFVLIKMQFRVSVAGCSVRIKNFFFLLLHPSTIRPHHRHSRVRASSRMG